MPIKHLEGGSTILTGDSIQFARICALKYAVKLEMAGIKMRRGPVIWKQAAREFGIKGGKVEVYAWLDAKAAELQQQQMHVMPDGRRYVDGQEVQ